MIHTHAVRSAAAVSRDGNIITSFTVDRTTGAMTTGRAHGLRIPVDTRVRGPEYAGETENAGNFTRPRKIKSREKTKGKNEVCAFF